LSRTARLAALLRRSVVESLNDSFKKRAPDWLKTRAAGLGRQSASEMSDKPDARSTTLSGVTAFSPWGSRSTTPKPKENSDGDGDLAETAKGKHRQGGDHAVSNRHRLSLRNYPKDCPPLLVQWYHAVDVRLLAVFVDTWPQ
jgi:hypothetical protein